MSDTLVLPSGDFGDLCVDTNGVQYLAIEAPPRNAILVYSRVRDDCSLVTLDGARWDAGQPWALMPRIACRPDGGQIAIVYQRGPVLCLVLRGDGPAVLVTWPASDVPFGVEMVGIQWMGGRWRMGGIVQRGQGVIRIVSVDYLPDGTEVRRAERPTDTTQGISRIDAAGVVHLVDEERIDPRWPDLHRPYVSSGLVVGENLSGPERVIGYQLFDFLSFDDGEIHDRRLPAAVSMESQRLRFFAGSGKQPRAIQTPTGYTVMAMGRGVARFVDGPPFELDAPSPPPVDPPPPPPPPPPTDAPPEVAIMDWQPREGPVPLIVNIDVARSGGPATRLTVWADSKQPFVIANPPLTARVSFGFDRPGTYAIGARIEGPGGARQTQRPRTVTVTEEEPEVPVQFPPRNETMDFVDRHLEPFYKDVLKESARNTHVNSEGYSVWIEGYLRRRVNGMDHTAAIADTMREVRGEPAPSDPS